MHGRLSTMIEILQFAYIEEFTISIYYYYLRICIFSIYDLDLIIILIRILIRFLQIVTNKKTLLIYWCINCPPKQGLIKSLSNSPIDKLTS